MTVVSWQCDFMAWLVRKYNFRVRTFRKLVMTLCYLRQMVGVKRWTMLQIPGKTQTSRREEGLIDDALF